MFDPAKMAWTNLSAASTPPAPRYGHGFAAAGGKIFVQGGWDGSGTPLHWPAADSYTDFSNLIPECEKMKE